MSLEVGLPALAAAVTAGNWQDPPFNRWAYWHVREILPTYLVSRGAGAPRALRMSGSASDLLGVELTRIDGAVGTVGEVLADTYTDAYVVLHDGELVTEWYGPQGAPNRTHALMSISKSVLGCVAG